MKKRIFWLATMLLMVAVVTSLTLAGCKEEAASSGTTEGETEEAQTEEVEAGEPITLRLVWSNEGDIPGAGNWFKEMADNFTAENPNITIEISEHTIDQLIPSWQAAVEAQSGVDIQFFWGGTWNLEDVWAGNIEDITKYIPEEEWQHWLNKPDVSFQGHPWIAPWYNFALPALVYNKSLFKEAGLDPEIPPTNWEEFITSCEALKQAGITGFAFGSKDAWGLIQFGH